jgi:hypothetical protein
MLLTTAVVVIGTPETPPPGSEAPASRFVASELMATSLEMDFSLASRQDDEPPPEDDEVVPPVAAAPVPFGKKGSRRWTVHGAAAWSASNDDDRFLLGGVGVSYFIEDDLALDLEANVLRFQQSGDDTEGINFNLLFRWHFLAERRWSLYLDGGAGVLLTSDHVPEDGTAFNFTPQAGLGVSIELGDDGMRLMTGVRWQHISNANTSADNPGRDNVVAYVGLSFPF